MQNKTGTPGLQDDAGDDNKSRTLKVRGGIISRRTDISVVAAPLRESFLSNYPGAAQRAVFNAIALHFIFSRPINNPMVAAEWGKQSADFLIDYYDHDTQVLLFTEPSEPFCMEPNFKLPCPPY